ncbi:MAG: hypothetical protein Q7R58_00240 [bacterium]|nr:hypothetical protein [bacterium]
MDLQKNEFLWKFEIESKINGLEFQRERIFQKEAFAKTKSPVHDVDFYTILLRRLSREVEKVAEYDSRVANFKGKNLALLKKTKIRDDFQHGFKGGEIPKIDISTLPKGIVSGPPGTHIQIGTSLVGNEIISGGRRWDLSNDHKDFIILINEFSKFYPFQQNNQQNCKTFFNKFFGV